MVLTRSPLSAAIMANSFSSGLSRYPISCCSSGFVYPRLSSEGSYLKGFFLGRSCP
jgi:hypothetical protein